MKKYYQLLFLILGLVGCQSKEKFDATGFFEATPVTVSAEVSGKILDFPIEEGDSVMSGESLLHIDSTMLSLQRQQLAFQQRGAASAAPNIAKQAAALRQQIAHAQEESDRIGRMLAEGAATRKSFDDSQAQVLTLKAQLNALTSSLQNSVAGIDNNTSAIGLQIQQLNEQIARCNVTSPIRGTVLTKYAQAGEFVTAGKPLLQLANLEEIYLRCYFTVSQLAELKLGEQVTVVADFGTGKKFKYPGKITWISPSSEFTPKAIQTDDSRANLVYAVKIKVHNDGRLKIGQYGEVILKSSGSDSK